MTKAVGKVRESAAATKARKPPQVEMDWTDSGALQVELHGDTSRFLSAAEHSNVSDELVRQLASLGSQGKQADANACNFALGFVDALKPRDAAEALLMSQMAAIHQATMMMARRLNHTQSLASQDASERALNKLARTFAAQMDTLKRYRSKGQQVVRVERVTVQDGGQAIVGNVEHRDNVSF